MVRSASAIGSLVGLKNSDSIGGSSTRSCSIKQIFAVVVLEPIGTRALFQLGAGALDLGQHALASDLDRARKPSLPAATAVCVALLVWEAVSSASLAMRSAILSALDAIVLAR